MGPRNLFLVVLGLVALVVAVGTFWWIPQFLSPHVTLPPPAPRIVRLPRVSAEGSGSPFFSSDEEADEEDEKLEEIKNVLEGKERAGGGSGVGVRDEDGEEEVEGAMSSKADDEEPPEEDEEMDLIYKLVNLAEKQEKDERERRKLVRKQREEREAEELRKHKEKLEAEQGKAGAQAVRQKVKTEGLVEDLTDLSCKDPGDCTKGCVQACFHQMAGSICEPECYENCQKAIAVGDGGGGGGKKKKKGGGGGGNREAAVYQCMEQCKGVCMQEQEREIMDRRDRCLKTTKRFCTEECTANTVSVEGCHRSCESRMRRQCVQETESECTRNCGRHVCVEGRCTCPIFFSGDAQCMKPNKIGALLPPRFAPCAVPITDDRFKKGSGTNSTLLKMESPVTKRNVEVNMRHMMRAWQVNRMPKIPDLGSMADFSTCAVVGSSGGMRGQGQGAEIDAHSAVIRFNNAPTRRYERDVGKKTTLRIQNVMYCGWNEGNSEICLHYTGWARNLCPADHYRKWKCTYVFASNRLLGYVQNFFAPLQRQEKQEKKDTSAGFFGLLVALHLCGRVDIYGFTQQQRHYFPKDTRSKTPYADKHSWNLERQCMNVFTSLPQVTKHK